MDDLKKTKTQLIAELQELRGKVAHLEAAAALRQSQTSLLSLAETAASAIFIFQDSVFRYANPAAARLTGYPAEELVGATIWDFVHPEHQDQIKTRTLAWLSGEQVQPRSEFKILTRSGESRWIDADATFIEFDGKPAALTIAYDSTLYKLAEQSLKESEQRVSKIIETAQEAVWMVDAKASTTYVNQRLAEMLGYERDELLGRSALDFVDDADRREAIKYLELGRNGNKLQHDFRFIRKDGSELWTIVSTTPLFDADGVFVGGLAMLIDVTERRRAEDALKKSEERYRELVENARDIIYSHDLNGKYTSVNKAVEAITGYTCEEALSRNFAETVAPEYLPIARQMIEAKLAGQKETVYDLDIIAKDGHRVTVEVNTRLVLQDNVPIGVQGIARDITARKRAEEALRHSEERFRRYFDLGLIGMAITSPTKQYLEVNDQLCEILGHERDELLQMTWEQTSHPEDIAANVSNFERVMAGEIDGYSMEKRYVRKDFTVIDTTISVKCMRRADGSVDYFVALIQDITARKQAEHALRESRSLLQAILDNCPSMIFLKDVAGRYLLINWVFERTFNLTSEQVLGRTDDEIFPAEVADPFIRSDRAVLEMGSLGEFEEQTNNGDGLRTYLVHKFPLKNAGGEIYAIGGISTEITERKRTEDEFRMQKERLQKIFDHIPVMLRFSDEKGNLELVNQEWQRKLGWTLEELKDGNLDVLAEAYPDPDYRRRVLDFIAAGTGEWVDFKTRVKDGRIIDTTWASINLASGTSLGIGQDITERNRANELLRRQAAQLAALHEIELEISAESDLSRIMEVVTRRAAELLRAAWCSTYIRKRDDVGLTLVASLESKFVGIQLKSGEGLAGRAMAAGETLSVDDYTEWEGRAHQFDDAGFGPTIAVTLKWQQIVIGVISLSRKRGEEQFTAEDSALLEQLAAVAAIAIHQATLFDEVQESQRRQQILSRRLIDVQEAERRRLSRELHDQIGQALTAVHISLQSLQHSRELTADRLMDGLADCLLVVDDALQQVHDLSFDLRPSLLDDIGLVAALRWYVDRVATRAGLVKRFSADVRDARLAPEVETACFRIAQEALTNVLRHAHAATVWVKVSQLGSALELVVQDDGHGFDVRGALSRAGVDASLGLQSMMERAGAVGGNVDIKSRPGSGAEVMVNFPRCDFTVPLISP